MFDKRLFDLVPSCKRSVALSVFFRLIALVANISVLYVFACLVLNVGHTGVLVTSANIQLMQVVALVLMVRTVCMYAAQRIADSLAYRARRTIQNTVYAKLLELGPSFSQEVSASEAMQTCVEGAHQLEVYYGGYLPQFVYAFMAPLILFALLVKTAGLAAVILILLVPLIPVSIVFIQKPARKAAKLYWANYVDLGGTFLQAVEGLTTLKIFQADERWHVKMNQEAEGFRVSTMNMLKVQLSSIVIMDLFAYGGAAVGIIVALAQLAAGHIDFLACFMIIFLSQEFFLPLRQLGSLFHAGMSGLAASRKMYAILDVKAPVHKGVSIDGVAPVLKLDQVSFSYGDREALSDITTSFGPRGLFALVGESGSGKSTLSAILSGRKTGCTGQVTYGGIAYSDIDSANLMQNVTLVGSKAHLFEGTVRENLCMAKPNATDEELFAALDKARITDFIKARGGLDLRIKEGASNLSGGQAQRIALARALLHDSPAYIFDEATSSIDVESERQISDCLADLARNHLVITVAHRLALVEDADKITVMHKGRIVEEGTHAELLAQGGAYAKLWKQQDELSAYAMSQGYESEGEEQWDEPEPEQAFVSAQDKAQAKSAWWVLPRLLKLVSPLVPYLLLAVLLGVIGHIAAVLLPSLGAIGLMQLANPSGGRAFFDCQLGFIFAGLLIAGIVRGPARYGEQLLNHYIAFRLLAHIRDLIFSKLRVLAPAKLEGKGKGDVVSLVTSDVELLEVFYAHTISPIAIATVFGIVMCLVLAQFSVALALVALAGYLIIAAVLPALLSIGMRGQGEKLRLQTGTLNAYVLDQLRGVEETIQYSAQKQALGAMYLNTGKTKATEESLYRRTALSESVLALSISLISLWALYVGFAGVANGTLSFAIAFVCVFTLFSSFGPSIAVGRLGTSLQQTVGSGARVLDLLDQKPLVEDVHDGQNIDFTSADIDHVSFGYGDTDANPLILNDVSLKIPEHTTTCIVGRSGCGKSTLLKLLMRFWEVDSGEIRLSDVDINQINTPSLRSCQAYMTQDTYLFDLTIRENIALVKPDATEEELLQACNRASLDGFIESLDEGLDTKVGDLGSSLSGGEKQRIGLARIFLYDAPLVLLDEPTSNLDALNEASVMRTLTQMKDTKTIVLVSHRMSTAAFADTCVTLESISH